MSVIYKVNYLLRDLRLLQFAKFGYRRPPHHRSLFRSKQMPFNDVYYDTDTSGPYKVLIDELNHYPPGQWGSMPIKNAWLRYKQSKKLQEIPTNIDKTLSMFWTEYNMWYHTVEMPIQIPETLEFAQFITRTKLIYSVPDCVKDSFSNISAENIKSTCDLLRLQINNYFSQTQPFISFRDLTSQDNQSTNFINQVMDTIVRSQAGNKFFENYATAPQSLIETFIKRSGYDELKVSEHIKDAEGCLHYRFRGKLAWHLRTRNPLKPFVDRSDPIFVSDGKQFPSYNYHPKIFKMEPTDCYDFQILPFIYTGNNSEHVRNIPGFWGNSHVKMGDPCGFSVLGVVNTNLSRKLINDFLPGNPEILDRHQHSEGLLSGFVWTMAEAQNQGFSIYDELTYPICTSLMLTNGFSIQFLYYQLNSISSLWKPEDAGLPVNMLWVSPKIDLCKMNDRRQVESINEHAVHQILASFSMPTSELNTEDLQPYLKDKSPRDVNNFILDFNRDTATEKELEEYRERIKIRRINETVRPHPNRLFYFESNDRFKLNQEFRDIVPGVDSMPTEIRERVAKFMFKKQQSKGRNRLLKYPTKWR